MTDLGIGDLLSDLWPVSLTALLVAAAAMVVTAAVAWRVERAAVVDVTWGLGFVLVALAGAVVGEGSARWVLAAAVAVWGLRLAWHIRNRAKGHGEDPRYAAMLGDPTDGTPKKEWFSAAVRRVFLVQGLAIWLISLPVQVGAAIDPALSWLVVVGLLVSAVGVVFEAVGDAQLSAYRALPKGEKPQVMETGLWRYTRHPNYFGDACVWWGLWLAGGLASGWWAGLLTILAPVAMTYFLVFATGAKLLEKTMMQRPGYPEYAARTSMFFPLPPKKG